MSSSAAPSPAGPQSGLLLLKSFARPYRRPLLLGLLLALAGVAAALATPLAAKWVLDALAASTPAAGPVVLLLALIVLTVVLGSAEGILLGTLGERMLRSARETLVRRILRATVPAIYRHRPGALVTRVTVDTTRLPEAVTAALVGLVRGVLLLLGSLVLMAVLDLALLVTAVVAVGVVVVGFAVLMPGIGRTQELAQGHVARLGGALEAVLRAVRTVKASRAEDRQTARILAHAESARRHGVRAARREAVTWTVAGTGVQLAVLVVLGVGAWRVGAGFLEVATFVAFLMYGFGLVEPIMELGQNLTALRAGMAAARRVQQVDALDQEPADPPGPAASTDTASTDTAAPVLELCGVTAAYGPGRAPAVDGVDLRVPARGHTVVVGPPGAGRSTLFALLLRFLEPQTGEIRLAGHPYRGQSPAQVRARLAYVEQEVPVVPGTIRDNLRLTHVDAADDELWAALEQVRLRDVVETFDDGLDTPVLASSLSGGQRQQIALARALVRTPEVLLLDEAATPVDDNTAAALHDALVTQARRGAVLTLAHRLDTVAAADTVVLMADGRVRAHGEHQELLATDELYRSLVGALRLDAPPVPTG